MITRAARALGWSAMALVVLGVTAWGTLALHYSDLSPGSLRDVLAGLNGLLGLTVLVSIIAGWRRRLLLALFAAAFVGLLLYWRTIAPSNDRDWAPEVARLPHATIAGDV